MTNQEKAIMELSALMGCRLGILEAEVRSIVDELENICPDDIVERLHKIEYAANNARENLK